MSADTFVAIELSFDVLKLDIQARAVEVEAVVARESCG
jgi:hypothetical protein